MRFNINLASQPYEVARGYRRRMSAAIAVLALVTLLLISYIGYQRAHSRGINRQLAEVHQEIDQLNHEEAQARAILNRPENRVVADQSEFLNELFARKALSWTRVFTEMERIVPPNLHVVSMKPEYTKAGDLMLHVVVSTDSRDRAVELVRRMEKSNHFRQAQVVAESVTNNAGADQAAGPSNIQFDIAAIYVPAAQDSEVMPAVEKTDSAAGASTAKQSYPAHRAAAPAGVGSPNPAQAQNVPLRPMQPRQH
jgi:type IV pilus assembly protein PilN